MRFALGRQGQTALITGLLLVVLWRVVLMASVLGASDAAGSLDGEPVRMALYAQQEMAAQRYAEARAAVEALLRAHPLAGSGYRMLGELALLSGDEPLARRRMNIALSLDPRDVQARVWLAEDARRHGDLPRAVLLYDNLMRSVPQFQPVGALMLQPLIGSEAGRSAVVRALSAAPPWRHAVLEQLARSETSGGPTLGDSDALMAQLERTGGLTGEERTVWYTRLVRRGEIDTAYAEWRRTLPSPPSEVPYNGSFRLPLAAAPFDWSLERVAGVVPTIENVPDGKGMGLKVEFYGKRVDFHHVRQLLRLRPGAYRLAYRYQLERLETALGVQWSVRCLLPTGSDGEDAGSGTPLHGTTGWRTASFDFTVPANCPAQWLTLSLAGRIPAERNAYGTVWFDDLAIAPTAALPPIAPSRLPSPSATARPSRTH